MDHPGSSVTFPAKEPLWPGRGPQRRATSLTLRDGAFRSQYAAIKFNVGNYSQVRAVTEHLINQGVLGAELDQQIRDRASRQVGLSCLFEQLPDPANRVVPSAGQRDALGLPRPEIYYAIEDYVRTSAAHAGEHFARFAELLGGTNIRYPDTFSGNNHMMGTTMMGNDPCDSVVDRDCRSHDHDNLFIASSSVFPKSAVVNPTLGIAALAIRIADTIRGVL
jgi:choline dehydrogenase-like flavoprotein